MGAAVSPSAHGGRGRMAKPDSDSLILARHVAQLKMSLLDLHTEDTIAPATLDSLLADAHSSIPEATVATSPDGKVKFFIITEDFCGAYCHYEYVSFVHLANGKLLVGASQLHPIDSIYILPDGKYLLLQSWGERAFSACSEYVQSATILSLRGDSIVEHAGIASSDTDYIPIEFKTSFVYYPNPSYLYYDQHRQTLYYQYGKPCSYDEMILEVHTGTLHYQHGVFVPVRDSVWTAPPGDDH